MRRNHLFAFALCALFSGAVHLARADQTAPSSAEAITHFEKHVRPILVEKCQGCHGSKKQHGGLRLDSRKALLDGGDNGPAIVSGKPAESLLIKAILRKSDLKMPPREADRLSAKEVESLSQWVQFGAVWPADKQPAVVASITEVRKTHWSFRPVTRPAPPQTTNSSWVINPIDSFILTKLKSKGLKPSATADRRTLIRRLSFDLLGLPPTPEDVEEFVTDTRPDAYERLVDGILSSPAYGERYGRHWLDVARYADTKGYVFTEERRFPYSYTYRDYVIDSLNADVPYDDFITQQLAADRLVANGGDRRQLAAMGFLTLGRRFLNNTHDIIDDRIDVVSRGLLGLTVTCARCHDHKFDPIPIRDYYSLYGVFASSTEPAELPLLTTPEKNPAPTAFDRELRKREQELDQLTQKAFAEFRIQQTHKVGDYLLATRDMATRTFPPALVARWRQFLLRRNKSPDPVFAPWHQFARLTPAEFPAKAGPLAEKILANKDDKTKLIPLVARAFADKTPASLADVGAIYNRVFADAFKDSPAPDADRLALRQVFDAPDSPINIPPMELRRFIDRAARNRLDAAKRKIDQHRATATGGPARAMVLVDTPRPNEPVVFLRGNPNNRGPQVPRQFLEILEGTRKPFTSGSGRLELARAITSPDNPLTARVIVNRLWMHHFGKALVTTPGDFGIRGETPSHPELLDWLAATFVEQGWSMKTIHRLMVLSATYRQSSTDTPALVEADPENRLLGRANRRRLEFEALRDGLLTVSGRLDSHMGGTGVDITQAPFQPRRTVYAFIERQNLPGLFRTFDLASPDVSTPQRHSTTVPQQSLFLMNHPFVHELARGLVARADVQSVADRRRIQRLYHILYGRPADADEVTLGEEFLRQAAAAKSEGLSAWEQYAQVLMLSNEFAFVD